MKIEYSIMNSMVLLCILGFMYSQAEGCNPYAETKEVVDPAKFAIAYLYNHITQLKFDFTMEVIKMKMDQTTRIYSIMSEAFISVMMEQIRVLDPAQDAVNRCKSWDWRLYKATVAATTDMSKCVESTSKIFHPVERNIEEFLDARTHCLLNLDDIRIKLCRDTGTENWEGCDTLATLIDPTRNIPLTCDHEKYIIKLKQLEDNASFLSKAGKDDVSRCLKDLEGKYNDTIKPITDFGIQCGSKSASKPE